MLMDIFNHYNCTINHCSNCDGYPPKDIMLALTPCIFIIINATRIAIGRVIITTNDDRRWNKNAKQTNTTTINSSSNFPERLSIALWIRSERSYTVIIIQPHLVDYFLIHQDES